MNLRTFRPLAALTALASLSFLPLAAQADVVTQTKSVVLEKKGYTQAGTSAVTLANHGDIKVSVNPFDQSLGTLTSFTVIWSILAENAFSAGPVPSNNAVVSGGAGGTLEIAGTRYGGFGNGGGNLATAGTSASYSWKNSDSHSFNVADAGKSYNPALLGPVLGSQDFDLTWNTNYIVSATDVVDLDAKLTGNVTLLYTYTPNASNVPEPASLLLVSAAGLAMAGVRRRKSAAA